MNKKALVKLIIFLFLCLSVGIAHAQPSIQKLIIQETPIKKTQLTAKEESFSFNPASTTVVKKGGNWVVVDKSKPTLIIASFGGNQKADADRALDIIKRYGMNQICFVKPGISFQYGLVSGKPPTGTYPGEACRSFNPNTLVVANLQGQWKIVQGSNVIFDFGTYESQARLVLSVIKKHGFTRSCSVGRPVGFHYMTRQTQTVSPVKPLPSPARPTPPAPAPKPKVVEIVKTPIKPPDIKIDSGKTKITIHPSISAKLVADPEVYSGPCPKTVTFKGEITVTDIATPPLKVEYRFIRSDGAIDPVKTLIFERPGSKEVSKYWSLGGVYSGWQAIKVISPQQVESNKANFKIQCTGEVVRKPEITGFAEECATKGGRLTILGRYFGSRSGKVVVLGTHGFDIPMGLSVVSWSDSKIVAEIPDDPRIQEGRSHYVGLKKADHTQWLSNINKNIAICKKQRPDIIARKTIGAPKSVLSISVRSPVKNSAYHPGLHTLPIEWTLPFEWRASGQTGEVKILLYPEGQSHLADAGQCTEIVKSTPNDGKFDWPIPSDFTPSRTGKFQVRVQTIDNRVKGDSEGFYIQSNRGPDEKGLYSKSITVTNPKEGEKFDPYKPFTIKWHAVRFPSDTSVRIIVCYSDFTTNPCCDGQRKNSTWQEIGRANVYAGSYTFKVGSLLYIHGFARVIVMVEYAMGMDLNEALKYGVVGYSGGIQIGDPKITLTSPLKSDSWAPLKPYTVNWDVSGFPAVLYSGPGDPSNVNIWLDQENDPNRKNSVLLAKGLETPVNNFGSGSGRYTGILGNVPSGGYRVRVEQSNNPKLYANSQSFTVKSTMHPDTIVIGPEPSKDEVDLALTEVFFDGVDTGYLTARIRNLGGDFEGSIKFDYEFEKLVPDTVEGMTGNKITGTFENYFSFKAQETQTFGFLNWHNFDYTTEPPHYKNYYIPRTGPWKGRVTITPSKKDSNPTNNKIDNVRICKTQKADIGTMGFFDLVFKSRKLTMYHGASNAIQDHDMHWISNDTFVVEKIEVVLWNYGCTERCFYCSLSVDDVLKLNVPSWNMFTTSSLCLKPGEKKTFSWDLGNIKVPFRYGPHRLVFIADEPESQNQGYPNSYMNNVIVTELWFAPL